MNFTDYASKKGCELLKYDISFIRSHLKRIPKRQIKAVMLRYVDEWVYAVDNAENALKAQNDGRRAANTFLREYGRNS